MYKPTIQIVSKEGCKYCQLAKQFLSEKDCNWYISDKLPIEGKTFPQIYIDDIYIGGYLDLLKYPEIWELNLFKQSKVYKPFKYPQAIELMSTHELVHWVEAEVNLTDDIICWMSNKLSNDEKQYIIDILRLFTQSDVSVGNLYYDLFIPLFRNNELRCMMGSFAAREGIHQKAYALLTDTLGIPESIYSTFLEYTEMADKMDFMVNAKTDTLENIALSIVRAVFNEGVSLFASFVMLLNFQRFGKMIGMGKVVEWSIRDESLHVKGMTLLFKMFLSHYPFVKTKELTEKVYKLANQVLDLETSFVNLVFKTTPQQTNGTLDIPSLDANMTRNYVKFILDKRLWDLGFKRMNPDITDPVPWVTWIVNGTDHTNFFENKVTEYDVSGLSGDWNSAFE